MKKILFFLAIATVGILWTGCSSDDSENTTLPVLTILDTDVNFDAHGGTGFVEVETDSKLTAVSNFPSWCHVSVTNNKVAVVVDPFTGVSSRTAIVRVTSNGLFSEISVIQQAAFVSAPVEVAIPRTPTGPVEAAIESTIGFTLTVPAEATWLTVTLNGDIASFVAQANPVLAPRSASVTCTAANGIKSYITVTQAGGTDLEIYNVIRGTNWTATTRINSPTANFSTMLNITLTQVTALSTYTTNLFGTANPMTINYLPGGKVIIYSQSIGRNGVNYRWASAGDPQYTYTSAVGFAIFKATLAVQNGNYVLKFVDAGVWELPTQCLSVFSTNSNNIYGTITSYDMDLFELTYTKPM